MSVDPHRELELGEPDHSTAYKIFFGQNSLRAGWGLLVFAFTVLGITVLLVSALVRWAQVAQVNDTVERNFRDLTLPGLVALGAVMLAMVIVMLLEQRRLGQYAMSGGRVVVRVLLGLLTGMALLGLLAFILRSEGLLVIKTTLRQSSHDATISGLEAFAAYALLSLALALITRSYVLYTATRGFAFLLRTYFRAHRGMRGAFVFASLLSSGLLVLLTSFNPGETRDGLITTFLIGLLCCWSVWRTGSIWWSVGFQAGWDWAQAWLLGTPDSGIRYWKRLWESTMAPSSGAVTVGPEGLPVAWVVLTLGIAAVLLAGKGVLFPELFAEAEQHAAGLRAQDERLTPEADPAWEKF